jgi:hypothetical protein
MDVKIKKQWLVSSFLYFTFLILSCLPGDSYFSLELGFGSKTVVIPFGYLVIESLNFLGLFLFSWKKDGTMLLSLNMLLSVFRICMVIFYLGRLQQSSSRLLTDSLILIFYLLLFVQWFIFSFKLRRANKLLKKNKALSHPEHRRVIQELQMINNLEELCVSYGNSVRSCPQIAGELKKVYTQRKLDLSKS